ncbi:MAG: hypothetical protein J7J86_07285 [Bacteroidales bacterium]|nr:hypothetical protein [Bacteroidales bacterium]
MLDCYLPWRYFVSDAIQNGVFPFWNPFQQLGYPIHADLRSVWNPVILFISIFTRYSNYTLHYLLIFYLFIAATGMYKFMSFFKVGKTIAFISGAAYMLSGFFISHTQEISAFSAAAFLPFVLLYYLKFFKTYKTINIIKVCIFLFFMITGAYPALTIISAYLLSAIFIYYFILLLLKKEYKSLKTIVVNNLLLLLIIILLSSVFIVIITQVSPYVSRINGMTFKDAIFGSFTPQSMISFLLPFSTVKDRVFFNTNFSMANAYFGVIVLIFFIYSLFKKKTSLEYLLLGFGVFALLASFGGYTPIRKILFDYFPLMNRFRFPGFFNLFTIFIFIFLAAKSLSDYNIFSKENRIIILRIALAIFFVLACFLFYSSRNISFEDFHFFNSDYLFWESVKKSTFYEHIFIQSLVQIIILSVFIFLIIRNKKVKEKLIGLLIILEMIIAVQFNMYYTGVSKTKPAIIKQYLDNCPKHYSVPSKNLISLNTDKNSSKSPLWKNTNIFRKKVSFDTFNSFQIDGYAFLNDSCPLLKEAMLKNYLLYFSDKIIPENLLKEKQEKIINTDLFVDKSVFDELKSLNLKSDINDSIKIFKFSPDNIIANFSSKNQQIITLLQSDYYGWKVLIDDIPVKHFTSNFLSISTIVPKGNHKIEFKYENKNVIIGFLITYIVFFILLIIILLHKIKQNKKYKVYYIVFSSLAIFILSFQIIKLINKDVVMQTESRNVVFNEINNFENNRKFWKLKVDKITGEKYFSGGNSYQIDSLSEYDCVFKAPVKNIVGNKNLDISVKIKVFINTPVNSFLVLSVLRNNERILWKGVPISDKLINLNKWQNIELTLNNNELKQGDIIKSYIWNKGKNNLYVDDFEIKIFSKDRN